MDEGGSLRLVKFIFRLLPLLMMVSLIAWCSSGRVPRETASGGAVTVELVELFMTNGLADGPVRGDQLANIARRVGPAGMNRLLYASAAEASLPALRWMVARGAEPRHIGVIETMPLLHKLAKHPQYDRLEYFLSLGLDPTQRDSNGRTVLHVVAEAGTDERVLELLRSKGLRLSDSDNAGRQPLHLASIKSIPVLAAAGADLAAVDRQGQTALHVAAAAGRQEVVTELLRVGASVFAVDKQGRTPLHLAALSRSEPTIDALLGQGAPRTVRDNDGLTPRDLADNTVQPTRRYRGDRDRMVEKL